MPASSQAPRSVGLRILTARLAAAAGLIAATASQPARAAEIAVYKSPWCACCEQ